MVNLAKGLRLKGHQVEFFIYHPQYQHMASQFESLGIVVYKYHKKYRFSPKVIWAFRKLVKSNTYDVMLSFLNTPNLYAELSTIAMAHPPLIVSERFMYLSKELSFTKRLLQQAHRLADYITVNSHHQRERMIQDFPWMAPKISTIYNGVDLAAFVPRPSFGQREGRGSPKLLVLASTARKKNALGLARALEIYAATYGTPPTIAWAGSNKKTKNDYQSYCEVVQVLDQYGLSKYWKWLGERSDVQELLHEHDALIHPSFYEGLPNAVCEALACGKPVLVSNVCDHPKLVQEGKTGFLFDPHNPQDIAKAIDRFATLQEDEREKMGFLARAFAEQELSLDNYVSKYEQLFEALMFEHNRRN